MIQSNQVVLILAIKILKNIYLFFKGIAMQQKLPVSNFRWLDEDEVDAFDITEVDGNEDDGYILECDLEYGQHLHEKHNDFPMAAERIRVPIDSFGKYQTELMNNLNIKYMEHQTKLIPHLNDRKNYTLHVKNLNYYLGMGLVLTKIHRILTFKQQAWLKPYIDFNTNQRMFAKNNFEKDFFKLMNNAVFGKGMENKRNRISVKLVNDFKKAKWYIAKPQYMSHDILCHNLVSFRLQACTVTLDKAIYTGFTILELSKLFILEFHYGFVKRVYGDKAKLLMTDTDSLSYEIQTTDIYKDMKFHEELFDFSEYPVNHPLFSVRNNKVLGKMKDEAKGNILFKFVGLGPKAYGFLGSESCTRTFEKKALKGIPKHIQKRSVQFDLLEEILDSEEKLICNMTQLRSYNHSIYTISVRKSALHGFDSKRFIQDDGINTLAWGHYLIPK